MSSDTLQLAAGLFIHPEGLLAQIKQHFSRNQQPPRPSGAPP